MHIQQATKKALKHGVFITRIDKYWSNYAKLKPQKNYLFAFYGADGQQEGKGWQPQVEDILADDWVVCD